MNTSGNKAAFSVMSFYGVFSVVNWEQTLELCEQCDWEQQVQLAGLCVLLKYRATKSFLN